MTENGSPSIPFFDVASSTKNLRMLEECYLVSGSKHPIQRFLEALGTHLSRTPDPDTALTNLLRFVEATLSKASLFNDLVQYPVLLEVLLKVLGSSQYFGDILVRDPELFRWLTASDSLIAPQPRNVLETEAARSLGMFQTIPRKMDALRRFYRREILRVGTRDILGNADLKETAQSLSNLADVLVDAACTVARGELDQRYGISPATPFVVIGLGKLGGAELNYSSDIDIMFVYENEGEMETNDGREVTHHEYFNKLAERIIVHLSTSTAEGHLFRVDTRLRPEGGVAPLARSMQSFLLYYEGRGELWERQMLIKARPVGGDLEFGRDFLRQLEPFVYPRTLFHHPAESVARLKARMEAAVSGEENIKLRAGGIRDIEFVVQTLQLLNGGRNRNIRSGNTLLAIGRLANEGMIGSDERTSLVEAYTVFRALEHVLQTMSNTQTHTLPEDARTQFVVARRMGVENPGTLRQLLNDHLRNVRRIFEDVLKVSAAEPSGGLDAILEGHAREETARAVLSGYGLTDIRRAAKDVAELMFGGGLTDGRDLDGRARDAFREVAEVVFRQLAATPSPDLTLRNLAAIAASQKFPELFYTQMKENGFRSLILGICAASPRFVRILCRDPLAVELLASDPDVLSGPRASAVGRRHDIAAYKAREETRAGIKNILGLSSFGELAEELSSLADALTGYVFDSECRKAKRKTTPLAVFALGKLGTREITFDADLDLLFVTGSGSRPAKAGLENIAAAVVNRLSAVSETGKLYDVDVRLRPEGKNAPLVVDVDAYRAYLHRRASLWERQSLTRLRGICGDKNVVSTVKEVVDEFVYASPLPSDWVNATVSMRRRTESRSRTNAQGYLDIKLGSGGMVDIEFLAQMIQLQYGRDHRSLRGKTTTGVLRESSEFFLSDIESTFLVGAYTLFREVEKHMRITLEDRGSVLPEGDKLELLARCVDGSTGGSFFDRLSAEMNEVRRKFLEISQRLSSNA